MFLDLWIAKSYRNGNFLENAPFWVILMHSKDARRFWFFLSFQCGFVELLIVSLCQSFGVHCQKKQLGRSSTKILFECFYQDSMMLDPRRFILIESRSRRRVALCNWSFSRTYWKSWLCSSCGCSSPSVFMQRFEVIFWFRVLKRSVRNWKSQYWPRLPQ